MHRQHNKAAKLSQDRAHSTAGIVGSNPTTLTRYNGVPKNKKAKIERRNNYGKSTYGNKNNHNN